MKLSELGNGLRKRQMAKGLVPRRILKTISDWGMVKAYTTDHKTKKEIMSDYAARRACEIANTTEEWLKMMDDYEYIEVVLGKSKDVADAYLKESETADEFATRCGRHVCVSIFDRAKQWAETNYPKITKSRGVDLEALCKQKLSEYPGIGKRRWLFVYSPYSMNTLFEVSSDDARMLVAMAKLQRVSLDGGMLFGVDCSTNEPKYSALAVL